MICLDCADAQVASFAAVTGFARRRRVENLGDGRSRLGESALTAARSAARRAPLAGAGAPS